MESVMEAVTPFPQRPDAIANCNEATGVAKTLSATATYQLSEMGRKASLLAGGNGRALQEVTIIVPATRIHLVSVDPDGQARVRLQPRYFRGSDQRIVRRDDPPSFDAVPTMDELLKEAARNHQLESTYKGETAEERRKQQDRWRELRRRAAEEFLADSQRRARVHPRPTPRQCYIVVNSSVVRFDAKSDEGVVRQVPAEAYRRFRADERDRVQRGQEEFKKGQTVHEEKCRVIAEWVAKYGSQGQRERHAAGLLPVSEVLEGMADQEFAAATTRPRYVPDGLERLQIFLRRFPAYATVALSPGDLTVVTERADDATDAQWSMLCELRAMFPLAEVTLQQHSLAWSRDPRAPKLTIYGALVRRKIGPFNVRREFIAPSREHDEEFSGDAHGCV